MDFWSEKQDRRLPIMTSGMPRKHQKNLNGTKPMLVNMVKAITTRSKTRNTTLVEGAKNSHH